MKTSLLPLILVSATCLFAHPAPAASSPAPLAWPEAQREARPWTYWWWMASAVDQTNLTRQLELYKQAGLGGVHIIPIYGAKGYESRFIDYLSPKWMEMLRYTVSEAHRLGLEVDMTTGSGWCFGGPRVTDRDANASVIAQTFSVAPGARLAQKLDPKATQALMAFSSGGRTLNLLPQLPPDGNLAWTPPDGSWTVYAISQKPSGQKVKRAGPGGQGHMLNLIYPEAMRDFLRWFDDAFAGYRGPKPRAMYHDSYEYRSDWAPDFFAAFEKRRGYRLQTELPALFGDPAANPDRAARVKSDYRETVSGVMAEESLPIWVKWSHRHGFITRNEAHGSPGNWLDLYAAADIPETEMFYKDRNKLISKFASSAAHVTGKPFVASETGTWVREHFTETLADVKYLFDDLFLSGVNHLFYHGNCYSPDDAPWPGWLFYASLEMNPRNSIWHDVPALNAYAARCQSVLQAGSPDNDILLYWPINDFWHDPDGRLRGLTVHARDWFEQQPIGRTADTLWRRGYAFDYVSDRQLDGAKASRGQVTVPGGRYRVVVVPPTQHLPLETFRQLLNLARGGATVLFEAQLPADVPGWGNLDRRRAQFQKLRADLKPVRKAGVDEAAIGRGRVLIGDVEAGLAAAGVPRESLFDQPDVMCVRRAFAGGRYYFIANRSENLALDTWVPLAHPAKSVVSMDPMTGRTGVASLRKGLQSPAEVYLQLPPGGSIILRCFDDQAVTGPHWPALTPSDRPTQLKGQWQVAFLQGGPERPAPFETKRLDSWTNLGDDNARRFAGTARYSLTFDAPDAQAGLWWLDLGRVCQSARVRLNGQDLGTLVTPPWRVTVPLQPKDNRLEVEVTNVSANRIRDLDRRGVKWKNFYDINFVNIDYRPFDASNWPLTDSGLLGPVTLTPVTESAPILLPTP